MMRRIIFLCALTHAVNNAEAITLPPGIPTISSATVNAKIGFDAASGIFTYSYTLTNSASSIGSIVDFEVDITTSPGGASLSASGLTNNATGYAANSSAGISSRIGGSLVPVGFLSAPLAWASSLSESGAAVWYGPIPPGSPIAPGHSLSEFVLASHGLPGIRNMLLEPHYNSDDFISDTIEDPDNAKAQAVADLDAAIQQAIKFRGVTIGPVQPPSLTDSGQLVDFLASLKHQAASLGWFFGPGSDGVVQSLDAKLSAAKRSVTAGDNKTAANQLNAFLNELRAQRGKTINENAFFLLQANAQFIMAKLGP